MDFIDNYVRSLITWDLLVFFHRNPDAVLDFPGLASRLGRRPEELRPEIDRLCKDRILQHAGGLVRYKPTPALHQAISAFAEACTQREQRLEFIARVLEVH